MATYRVYLAKPTTMQGVWDWAQTTVAPNASTAIRYAYDAWVMSVSYDVPPLAQCRSMVGDMYVKDMTVLSRSANLPLQNWYETLTGESLEPTQKEYVKQIEKKIASLLGSKLDGEFHVVSYPSGFHYGITYGANAYYNVSTLEELDTCVTKDAATGQLILSSTRFSTLYKQILENVDYMFSKDDQKTMNDQDSAASAQIASVLCEFENAGGEYSDPLPKLGGKLQDVFNQILDQFGSFEKMPDTLSALRNAIAKYKEAARQSYVLHNRWYTAMDRIDTAKENIKNPAPGNGGLEIRKGEYYVGYKNLPTANQLLNGLKTVGNKITLSISMDSFSGKETNLHIESSYSVRIPVLLFFSVMSGSVTYDLSTYTSSESKINIDITYPGVTVVSSTMLEQSANNKKGWYENTILSEVVAKTGKDETGYQLQGSEFRIDNLFGKGMTFSRLKTYVISQEPTIIIKMSQVDVDKVEKNFEQSSSASFSLFGWLKIGNPKTTYTLHEVKKDVSTSTITLTFGPADLGGSTPAQDLVTYVIGGVPSYPPNDI